ncbi:CDP-diacylglycerol--serine O-phosphatidyltransferase [Balamuthia mandrillaris]
MARKKKNSVAAAASATATTTQEPGRRQEQDEEEEEEEVELSNDEGSDTDGGEEEVETEEDNFARALPKKLMEDDPSLNWFQKPHTITMLVVGGIVLIYGAFTRDSTGESVDNVKTGLVAAALAFLVFCMLYLHDGPFKRPHPAVWRVVTGLGVLYQMSLVYLLFQTKEDVRLFLKHFDPKLGVPLPERSYAVNCDVYTPNDPVSSFRNVWDTVNDEFVLAHVIGWFGKTLLIRDAYVCVFISVLFEVWELTLEHQLHNFAECWWDHIILDILICNNLGIIAGLLTCRYLLKMKEYNWTGLWASKKGKLVRNFLPEKFEEYHWEVLSNWRRCVSVLLLCLAISITELNAFYLKFILWVPPPHPLNIARLLLWLALAFPALREYYQFVSDPKCYKMGSMSWLCVCLFSTEALLCVKFGWDMFPKSVPPEVFWPWVFFLVASGTFGIIYFSRKGKRPPAPGKQRATANCNHNNNNKKKQK